MYIYNIQLKIYVCEESYSLSARTRRRRRRSASKRICIYTRIRRRIHISCRRADRREWPRVIRFQLPEASPSGRFRLSGLCTPRSVRDLSAANNTRVLI